MKIAVFKNGNSATVTGVAKAGWKANRKKWGRLGGTETKGSQKNWPKRIEKLKKKGTVAKMKGTDRSQRAKRN